MNNRLKDYFAFSKSERRGIFLLIFLIIIVLIIRILLPFTSENIKFSDAEKFAKEIKEWEKSGKFSTAIKDNVRIENKYTASIFRKFDPNSVTNNDLEKMGIKPSISRAWINFLKKGGRFYKPDDLFRIYGFDTSLYKQLESYIYFTEANVKTGSISNKKEKIIIELNKANKSDLEILNGIGPVLSERIINYRNILGGFYDISQIKEVYGISDSIFNLIKGNLYADSSLLKKINLNSAPENILVKHPYLKRYYCKAILKFRELKGYIDDANELKMNKIIPDSVFIKIYPYITF